jgi:hypothetical protein
VDWVDQPCAVPQQTNGVDCGVFLCMAAHAVAMHVQDGERSVRNGAARGVLFWPAHHREIQFCLFSFALRRLTQRLPGVGHTATWRVFVRTFETR